MAKNVFNATLEPNNNINVNAFDLSHVFHGTFDQGIIYPVMWHRFPNGSSGRINLETGIQQFQTVFPLQTSQRVRFNCHVVSLRSLDEDYEERTVGNSETLEPWISTQTKMQLTTGSLSDYLGLCTTKYELSDSFVKATLNSYSLTHFEVGTVSTRSNLSNSAYSINGSHVSLSITNNSLFPGDYVYVVGTDSTGYVYSVDRLLIEDGLTYTGEFSIDDNVGNPFFRIFIMPGVDSSSPEIEVSYVLNPSYQVKDVIGTGHYYRAEDMPSAYPYRAYEAIYNSFYRDTRNNPRLIDGKPIYNKWLPSRASGEDKTFYGFRRSNWSPDAFTTAVPDPQQGLNAPLVGLTTYTRSVALENGEYKNELATAIVDEDGKAYGLDFKSNEDGTALTEVTYTELGQNPTLTSIQTMADLANQGFSIETLRSVNAYQKYLELNMRKGYLYKDIIQGRWDINIKYDELLMPEFVGGMSRELNTNAVTMTYSDPSSGGSYADTLGNQVGISGVYGNMDNSIEFYCDEESIVMVTMTIVPLPIYSQITPKQFFYRTTLDSFQPEFDHIGFQPIMSREISPVPKTDDPDKIFGYQRPWYEYLWKPDTAHGDFRLSLRNFLMQRHFVTNPELSTSFLTVDRNQLNDVYAVQSVDNVPINDHYFGYIKFNFTARLPITRVAIPRLD